MPAPTSACPHLAGHLFRILMFSGVSAISLAPAAHAQEIAYGSLRGDVTEIVRGINLQGAVVEIPALALSESVDREGSFIFRRVPAGEYEILVTYQGKSDIRQTVSIIPGETAILGIEMEDLDSTGRQDTIYVTATPIADSEAAAYSRQKAADNLVNIVAADTIGRFPDQNVAGALSRLPGVSVERDQGQERYVNLRGAPNKWTTISFNGINVVSPEGRASRLDTIPNSIVSSIEVTKAVKADMPADTIAGNINIITRSPFDHDGFRVSGEAGIGLMQLGGGEQNNYALSVSDTFANDTFGYVISGSYYRRNQVTDNTEGTFEFAPEDTAEGNEDRIWPKGPDYRIYHLVRANKGLSARVDWQPNADHHVHASSIFTEFTDEENRDQIIFDLDTDASRGCYADISCGNTPRNGTIYGVQIDATFNTNEYKENIWTNTLAGDHYLAGWNLDWKLNYTYAEDVFYGPARYTFASPSAAAERPSIVYDYTDPDFPVAIPYKTIVNSDRSYTLGERWTSVGSENLDYDWALRWDTLAPTRAWSGRLDLDRQFDIVGIPTYLKFGAAYDTRQKSSRTIFTYITEESLTEAGLPVPTFADISKNKSWDGEFPQYFAALRYDEKKAVNLFRQLEAAGGSYTDDDTYFTSVYRVQEDVYAAYAMATASFDWGNIVAGLRAERSENSGSAFGEIEGADGYQEFSASSERTDYFPSLHANWDITDNQKLRLSFNTGISRPDYDTRAPNFFINDEDQYISGGNPYADPERTYGIDAYYEWYLKPVGILSAGAFYKRIEDPLMSLRLPAFGSDQLNTPELDRSEYAFSTTGNGEEGYYRGLEFAYAQKLDFLPDWGLPEWTDGFGLNGNLTLVDGEMELSDGRKADLPGASDMTYNTSAYWEKHGFSVRVNWQWRTKWLSSHSSTDPRLDLYWAELGRLSLGMRYQLNENFEWFFDADNLTDQVGRRIYGDMSRVYEVEGFGERYMTGVRFNF
ncbi:MAG: TonB-dependent receptor [Hyphomonas sp.]